MKIPLDIHHIPLLIDTPNWYIANPDCLLWSCDIDKYLSTFYPECAKYVFKKSMWQ